MHRSFRKNGHIRGKENIIAYYREAYPDKAAMGLLTLELDMFSTPPSSEAANTATAIIRYTVRDESGEEF